MIIIFKSTFSNNIIIHTIQDYFNLTTTNIGLSSAFKEDITDNNFSFLFGIKTFSSFNLSIHSNNSSAE